MTVPWYGEAINHLAKAFRAGVPLRTALDNTAERYGSLAWDTPEAQKCVLSETILYTPDIPGCASQFCFGRARCGKFMRLLMDEIDRIQEGEMDETFAEYAAALCQSDSSFNEEFSYVMFEVSTGNDVKSREIRNVVIHVSRLFNDIGHRVWESGVYLYAELVNIGSELRKYFAGRRVLELGAGTGLSAGAYGEAGVEYALLTDYEERIVSNMEYNIGMNVSEKNWLETGVVDGTDCAEVVAMANSKMIDTVVAADLTYDKDLLVGVVKSFGEVVTNDRIGFLVVTERNENSMELVRRCLGESGVEFEVMDKNCSMLNKSFDYLVGWDFSRVNVLRVWR